MDESLAKALLDMETRDRALHAELATAGEVNDSHHPRVEELHRANSSRLRQIVAVFGWPGRTLVGDDGARAAWRIAMHSGLEPEFMRQCRELIDHATQGEEAPRWQFAFIDDRIRVYEGRPQRYGTQLRHTSEGIAPYAIENEARINSMRAQAGLPLLAQTLAQARSQGVMPPQAAAAREAAELDFRRRAGWIAD